MSVGLSDGGPSEPGGVCEPSAPLVSAVVAAVEAPRSVCGAGSAGVSLSPRLMVLVTSS